MYTSEQIVKKEMLGKISKCLCLNLFIGVAAQLRAAQKDHEILVTLKKRITLSLSFQTPNTKFLLFDYCCAYKNIFRLFDDSANKTKAFYLRVNSKKLRLVFVHHVNTGVPKYLRLFEQVDTLHF